MIYRVVSEIWVFRMGSTILENPVLLNFKKIITTALVQVSNGILLRGNLNLKLKLVCVSRGRVLRVMPPAAGQSLKFSEKLPF